MSDVKQVIVVRKDLNLKKGKLAAYVAEASMLFLVENNDSPRRDEFTIKLNPEESIWLTEGQQKIILGINSGDALRDLLLKAELDGVEAHHLIVQDKAEFDGDRTLVCASFGPASSQDLSKIIGKLKPI
jgi:PTH2 family peptidyl-tRNA hydrolase